MEFEAGLARQVFNGTLHAFGLHFRDRFTLLADQKYGAVVASRSIAGKIGIAAFNAVNQTDRLQELKGTVNLGRCGSASFPVKLFHEFVNAQWAMTRQQQLKDRATIRGEALITARAFGFRVRHTRMNASFVIVLAFREK